MRIGLAFVFAVFALAGCGGSPAVTPDSGAPEEDASIAQDSGPPPADAFRPDAGSDAGAPESASVAWVTVVEPREVDGDIALEYGFEYLLEIEGDPFVYSLELERCIAIAGMPETCDTGALSNLPGSSFVRFGVDPSMYAVGENHYVFHLSLTRDGELVDEDTLDVELDVTSCETCVGSDAMP